MIVDASHFEQLRVMGKGGFGKVFAAKFKKTGEMMAMKVMKKSALVAKSVNITSLWIERNVMAQLTGPYSAHLFYACQDVENVYLIMNFLPGGDFRWFMSVLKQPMSEKACRFYAAEILLALEELHSLNILYRDMKPENILRDAEGHVTVIDFGLSVILSEAKNWRASGRAGTNAYMAPEVSHEKNYGFSADVWSWAITIFEFAQGRRPFNKEKLHEKNYRFDYKEECSPEFKDLMSKLFVADPKDRIGCGEKKWGEIKAHPWFQDVDWDAMLKKSVEPPYPVDTTVANCDGKFDLMEQLGGGDDGKKKILTEEQQAVFQGFELFCDLSVPRETGAVAVGRTVLPSSVSADWDDNASSESSSSQLTRHNSLSEIGPPISPGEKFRSPNTAGRILHAGSLANLEVDEVGEEAEAGLLDIGEVKVEAK